MTETVTIAGIARGLNMSADRYSQSADKAEAEAATRKDHASFHYGRAGALRQAAIDFRTLADLAAEATA